MPFSFSPQDTTETYRVDEYEWEVQRKRMENYHDNEWETVLSGLSFEEARVKEDERPDSKTDEQPFYYAYRIFPTLD